MVGSHHEKRLPHKNYNRQKNGAEKDKRKIENEVIGQDDEGRLQ